MEMRRRKNQSINQQRKRDNEKKLGWKKENHLQGKCVGDFKGR